MFFHRLHYLESLTGESTLRSDSARFCFQVINLGAAT